MAFQLSPGVNVSEYDLTTIVPSVGTTEGAIAGQFNWGPANTIVTISNEIELADRFGKPDSTNFATWFTAANFLSYARNLKVVRSASSSDKNANDGSGILIENQDDYNYDYLTAVSSTGTSRVAARYPGDKGNGLEISMFTESGNNAAWALWAYKNQFDSVPSTSNYASGRGTANDEIHIIVIDQKGKFTGTPNTILEKFAYVSKASDAKTDDGSSSYYVNVINDRSKYFYVMGHAANSNWGISTASGLTFNNNVAVSLVLANGVSSTVTNSDLINGYDKFKNAEEVDISLIMAGAAHQTVSDFHRDRPPCAGQSVASIKRADIRAALLIHRALKSRIGLILRGERRQSDAWQPKQWFEYP